MLIFLFHSKKTAAEAHRELQKVYGDAALSETTCRDWFRRFKDGHFNVDDRPREGSPKTFEDAELEAIAQWGSVSNARSACFSIRSYPPIHFLSDCMLWEWFRNRGLGFLWVKTKGCWTSILRLRITAPAAKKEGFSSSHPDGRWKIDSLQQSKEKKVMGTARSCFYVGRLAEYSRCVGYAMYLLGILGPSGGIFIMNC